MKAVYKTLVYVGAIVLAACSRNIVPETGNQDSPYKPVEYDIDDELEPSVWYASAVPDYMKQTLGLRNVSIADNIDEAGIVPAIARTDQRMDFSWVWHVHSGCYAAKDNDFGNMKIKIGVTPIYKTSVTDSKGNITGSYLEETPGFTTGFDLPGLNRIPAGEVKLTNTSRYYISNILFYRSGEYGIKSPYYSHSGAYDTDQTASILMREGEYDIIFEKIDGTTRESHGCFIKRGVIVEADKTVSTSTMLADEL